MKKILYSLIALAGLFTSCDYLNISPDMGIEDEDVFSNYANFKNYLYSCYHGGTQWSSDYPRNTFRGCFPIVLDCTSTRFTFNTMTDISDSGRPLRSHVIKGGSMADDNAEIFTTGKCPIFESCFVIIRIANKCIENIDMIQDATEEEKYDLLGQAYFIRAFAHYTVCNYFGGVPYLKKALSGDDGYDLPRLTAFETYTLAAEDALEAYKCFEKIKLIRRDPLPGMAGNLESSEQKYPAGMAALALRSRILLYRASPLNNTDNDPKAWQDAAEAASLALDVAAENGFSLQEWDAWENNWKFSKYTNEQLWAYDLGAIKSSDTYISPYHPYPISNNKNLGGVCPTQNAVDLYETIWGEPLETESDREKAIAAGHYKDQDPYSNRDPRFYKLVTFDGSTSEDASVINIHYDPVQNLWPTTTLSGKARSFGVAWGSEIGMGVSNTGYYSRKYWDGKYVSAAYNATECLFRLAEVYLNYAEAVNEIYGPTGSVEGQITALQAVNTIRDRAGMPDVLGEFTRSKEAFRARIQNERTIEFMDEDHHYYIDIRRWMTAPKRMRTTLYGMYIESCPVSAEYPKGRKYVRTPLAADRQSTWKDEMYYLFLPAADANKMSVFKNNKTW